MSLTKLELEKLIREKKTLGNYIFNEKKKCFIGDVEIILYLSQIDVNLYESEMLFWDGYEISLENSEKEIYKGSTSEVKKQALESFHSKPEFFMNYPIVYSNVSCEISESEKNY